MNVQSDADGRFPATCPLKDKSNRYRTARKVCFGRSYLSRCFLKVSWHDTHTRIHTHHNKGYATERDPLQSSFPPVHIHLLNCNHQKKCVSDSVSVQLRFIWNWKWGIIPVLHHSVSNICAMSAFSLTRSQVCSVFFTFFLSHTKSFQ